MNTRIRNAEGAFLVGVLASQMSALTAAPLPPVCPTENAVQFCDVEDLTPPAAVVQLIYSAANHALVINSGSEIDTIDLSDYSTSIHLPKASYATFTDMAISPSGRYVFAADWGGDNEGTGSGLPYMPNYVHRLDLTTLLWDQAESAWVAGNIQAVADDQVILKSTDQWVSFTNDRWTGSSAMTVLNDAGPSYWAPAYYPGVYEGNFRFDPNSGRILHGNSNLSSQEMQAFRLTNDNFVPQEGTGTYGVAQGYGGTIVMSTDHSGFYFGSLEVDPLDVTHKLHVYQEWIRAATGNLAFGGGSYYNAHTAEFVGYLGFTAFIYALNASGTDFWVYDSAQNLLRHFVEDDLVFGDNFGG